MTEETGRSYRSIGLVALGFGLLLGAYLLGRATPEATTSPLGIPTAEPADSPTTEESPDDASTMRAVAVPGAPLADLDFGADRAATVLCVPGAAGDQQQIVVSTVDRRVSPPTLLTYEKVTEVDACSDCTVDVIEVGGERMGIGHCSSIYPTIVLREANPFDSSMAFVVANPPNDATAAVGLVLRCGQTEIHVDGDDLMVRSKAIDFSEANTVPPIPRPVDYPAIRFSRRGDRFYTDDLPLLRHFCNASSSAQLEGYLSTGIYAGDNGFTERSDLAYLETDSKLGAIGFRRQVLIAITAQQCNVLQQAQWESRMGDDPAPVLAMMTGLTPPADVEDWYLICQVK